MGCAALVGGSSAVASAETGSAGSDTSSAATRSSESDPSDRDTDTSAGTSTAAADGDAAPDAAPDEESDEESDEERDAAVEDSRDADDPEKQSGDDEADDSAHSDDSARADDSAQADAESYVRADEPSRSGAVGSEAPRAAVASATSATVTSAAVEAPDVVAAEPIEPAPSPLAVILREWSRIFTNAAPTLPSREIEISLQSSAAVSGPITLGGQDPDGDVITYTVAARGARGGPRYGTITIDQSTGTFTYDPDDAATGERIVETFFVTASDGGVALTGLAGFFQRLADKKTTATFTLVVGPVNEAPKANDDAVSAIANSSVAGNVLANDTDRENQPLSASLVSGPRYGILTLHSDGTFTYTPNADFVGEDGFTYTAWDTITTSATARVVISVASVVAAEGVGTKPTLGVQGLTWWLGLSDADTDRALDMAKSAGIESFRLDISWYVAEYTEGTYNWWLFDPLVDKIVARDMTVLGMLYDTPGWLSGSTEPHTPPTDVARFAQFASAAATHYLGRIDTWEIWNEPNIPRFWATPDAAAYAELLKAVYPAIKSANGAATVITGGLSPDSSGIDPLQFVTALYAAGAGGHFDALSMHPYAFPFLPVLDSVTAVHNVMAANGDGAKKIWLTEVGAPTGTSPWAMSEEGQALAIATFVDWSRTVDYVGPVYLYSLLDTGSDPTSPEQNFGLIRTDFTPKPAFGIWL